MKLKNILIAMASVLAAASFSACSVEDAVQFPVIATKQAVYEVPAEGGEVTVAIESNVSWTASMAASTSKDVIDDVKLLTEKGTSATKDLKLSMGANTGYTRGVIVTLTGRDVSTAVLVKQAGLLGERLDAITIAEFNDLPVDASVYYQISGTVTKITQSSKYSNFYLNDGTGEIYVYGLYDGRGGSQFTDGWLDRMGIQVGYTMTIGATRGVYGTTKEAKYAYPIEFAPPTTPIITANTTELSVSAKAKEAKFTISVMNLKGNWTVSAAEAYDWVTDYTKSGSESGDIVIALTENESTEEARVAKFTVASEGAQPLELTLTQEKSTGLLETISIADFIALPADDTNVYQIAGIVSGVKTDGSDKYGNFYISDKTGKLYIYGFVGAEGGATRNFVNVQAEMGLKDGDYMIVQGARSVYKNNPQLVNAWYMKHYPYKTAAEFNALEDNDEVFYTVSGKVKSIANETYGNVYIEDETGEVYIYGILNWNGESKKFSELGIKVGDKITGYTIKTSYKESSQAKNMQIVLIEAAGDEGGNEGGNEGGTTGDYTSNLKFTVSEDNASFDNSAVSINGTENVYNVKLGSSKKFGSATATLPAGTKKVSFYSVAWKGAPASIKFTIGDVEKSFDVAANTNASGSGPFEFTLTASDKYELVLDSALAEATDMKVETYAGNNTGYRAFIMAVKAE